MELQELTLPERLVQKGLLYQKQCLIGLAALIALLAIILSKGSSYTDCIKTEEAYSQWEASPNKAELFDQLLHALKKTPTLADKYDAEIAQKLIKANDFEKAKPFAKRAVTRLQKEAPFYASFAETTLLIEEGSYQGALEKAMSLKERMGAESSVLQGHNLLRIAFLQKKLENSPGEEAAWNELEALLENKETLLSQSILQSYRDREIDLYNYIAERRAQL